MIISNKLKKKFCKDTQIPISVFKDNVFENRIKLYDNQYGSVEKWENFKKMLNDFNGEQDYFEYYNKIKDNMILYMKNKKEYQEFNNKDTRKFLNKNYNIKSKMIYKESNIGKRMISIDMKKANYACLKYYNNNIVDNTVSYEEFISKFTQNKHIINSKYIRQVIFGSLNPKRQVSYQKYMMSLILDELLKFTPIEKIEFYSNDEIVLNGDEGLYKKIQELCKLFNFETRVEFFKLIYVKELDCYLKDFGNKNFEIKCINGILLPILLRLINQEKIREEDLMFYHDNRLAKLIEYPKQIEVLE